MIELEHFWLDNLILSVKIEGAIFQNFIELCQKYFHHKQ